MFENAAQLGTLWDQFLLRLVWRKISIWKIYLNFIIQKSKPKRNFRDQTLGSNRINWPYLTWCTQLLCPSNGVGVPIWMVRIRKCHSWTNQWTNWRRSQYSIWKDTSWHLLAPKMLLGDPWPLITIHPAKPTFISDDLVCNMAFITTIWWHWWLAER